MNRNKKVSGKSFVAKASAASLALMMTATSVPATTLTAFAAETPEAAYAAEFEAFTEADKEVTSNKYISLIGNKTIYTGDNKVKVIKSKKSGVTIKKITSSKTSVVKVDKKGVLTAVKPGTATITVTTNQGTVKCKITVKDAISFATPKLYAGGKATTVLTKVDKKSTITSVTSSKKDVATITKAGKLTPIKKGTTKLTIKVKSSNGTTKTYTKSYTVMADGVKTLTIKTNPTKMVYQVGDKFDKTGLTLDALYKSGKKSVIAASKVTVSGFDSSKAGTSTVKLSYAGKSLSLKVTIKEATTAKATGITVTAPEKVAVGTTEDTLKAAVKVAAQYSDGTTADVTEAAKITVEGKLDAAGTVTVTAEWNDFTATATVNVEEKAAVSELVVTGNPSEVEFASDWAEAKKAIKVTAKLTDGTEEDVTELAQISDVDTMVPGDATYKVTYAEKEVVMTVAVKEPSDVEDVTAPTIESVTALDNKHIKVVFSEKMDRVGVETAANYSIYSYTEPAQGTVELSDTHIVPILQADGKTVIITILTTGDLKGFVNNGLSASEYQLYIDQSDTEKVQDLAQNVMIANSNMKFTGSAMVQDATIQVQKAALVNTTKELTLAFTEPTDATTADMAKMSITDGTTTVALTGASANVADSRKAVITLKSIAAADYEKIEQMDPDKIQLVIAKGAFKAADGNEMKAHTVKVNTTVLAKILESSYDENTSILTLNFSKLIDAKSVNPLKFALKYSVNGGADTALTTLDDTHYTILKAESRYTKTLQIKVDDTAKALIQAQRATAKVSYTVEMLDDAVIDSEELANKAIDNVTVAEVKYVMDEVAPTITEANYYKDAYALSTDKNGATSGVADAIQLTLSEKIATIVSAASSLKIAYVDPSGTEKEVDVEGDSGTIASNDDGAAIKLPDGAKAGIIASIKAGTAKLKVLPTNAVIKDVNGNAAKEQEIVIKYNDNRNPQVTVASASVTQVTLAVDTNLKANATYSVSDFELYKETNLNKALEIESVYAIDTNADGMDDKVYVTAKEPMTVGGNYVIKYKNLKDSMDKVIPDGEETITAAADDTAPKDVTNTYIDSDNSNSVSSGDKIIVTYDEPVVAKTVNEGEASWGGFGKAPTVTKGERPNQVVITLGADVDDKLAENMDLFEKKIPTGIVEDATKNASSTSVENVKKPEAAVEAKLVSAEIADTDDSGAYDEGDMVVLTFDKDVRIKESATLDGAALGNGTGAYDAAAAKDFVAKGNKLTFSLGGNNGIATTRKIKIGVGTNILNSWGQSADTTSAAVDVVSQDKTNPTLMSARFINASSGVANSNEDFLVLRFSESIHVKSGASEAEVVAGINADGVKEADIASINQVAKDTVVVMLKDTNKVAAGSKVSITGFGTELIQDAAGNATKPGDTFTITDQERAVANDSLVVTAETIGCPSLPEGVKGYVIGADGALVDSPFVGGKAPATTAVTASTTYYVAIADATGKVQITKVTTPASAPVGP